MRALLLSLLAIPIVACGGESVADAGADGGADAGSDAGDPATYPVALPTPTMAACRAEQAAAWTFVVPASCASGTCIDARGLTFRDGAPWVVRGVYDGGREVEALLANCPAGAACAADQPADHGAYLRMLADAGFDVLIDDVAALTPEMRAAIGAEPRIGVAQTLFGDPFTMSGHDMLAAQIDADAVSPLVRLWFGPDEPDLNGTWPMATGLRRLLRGSSPAIDALLAGRYRPTGASPYLPATEAAHDAMARPFMSAVVIDDRGLAVASDVYDAILPVTYPFQEPMSRADTGEWSIERASTYAVAGVPTMPVLQMVGIDSLGLIRPSAAQVRVEILGSLVHGAVGAFYYKLAGDDPAFAGRTGWFAADDHEAWAAYTEVHALWDRLVPVYYGDATVEHGTLGVLEYRRYTRGDHRVVLVVNPTPYDRAVDLDTILARAPGEAIRSFTDCSPWTARSLVVPGYATYALEVLPAGGSSVANVPGDPLAAQLRTRAPLPATHELGTSWETLAPLSAPRSSHVGVALDAGAGTVIGLAGGYSGALVASNDADTHALDGTTTLLPLLLTPTASASSGLLGTTWVIAGGVSHFDAASVVTPLVDCQRWAMGDPSWTRCAAVGNGAVTAAATFVFDDELYLAGGIAKLDPMGNLTTEVVERYSRSLDTWRAETHLESPRANAAALVAGGRFYVVGGFAAPAGGGPAMLTHAVATYDLVDRQWLPATTTQDLPTPRADPACVTVAGYGYCLGGYDAAGDDVATVERLDFTTGTWTTMPALPEPLSDLAALDIDGALVAVGGLDASFADSARVYRLR